MRNVLRIRSLFVLILLCICMFPWACKKSESPVPQFRKRADAKETFVYFADPHLSGKSDEILEESFRSFHHYYDEGSMDFCLCGGDWLNKDETLCQAYTYLAKVNTLAEKYFAEDYYPVLGNHDTNYQGRMFGSSSENTGRFTQNTIDTLMFGRFGRAYYSFETQKTKWLVLDSGLDWEPDMTPYRWEQIRWMGSELEDSDKDHVMVVLHIYVNYASDGSLIVQKFAEHAMNMALSYNAREVMTPEGGATLDFHDASGHVACFLCGHIHADRVFDELPIPVVSIGKALVDDVISFDLCTLDWDAGKLIMQRIGTGEDRIIDIVR